jgi:hypothetical protein
LIKPVAVCTPVYKKNISEAEQLCIDTLLKYEYEIPRYALIPESFVNDNEFLHFWKGHGYEILTIEDKYLKSIKSYNELMLSKKFYELFLGYEEVFIYQLDAILLKRGLSQFLSKYSYIGAPWIKEVKGEYRFIGTGNGGSSLRNIKQHLDVLNGNNFYTKLPASLLDTIALHCGVKNIVYIKILFMIKLPSKVKVKLFLFLFKSNEDFFWGYFAQLFNRSFKVAPPHFAIQFAFEKNATSSRLMNGGNLPITVHAWERYDREYWLKVLNGK